MIFYHYMNGIWPQPGQVVTQTNQVADIVSAVPGPILVGGSARNQPGIAASNTIISIDDVRASPGTTVTVSLQATNMVDTAGGEFTVVYDPDIIQSITVTTNVGRAFYDDGTGRFKIALASGQASTGDGVLATMTLQIAPTATIGTSTPLTLAEARLNDLSGRDLATSVLQQPVERRHGEVSIGSADTLVYLPLVQR
jgi:hypothetical protein